MTITAHQCSCYARKRMKITYLGISVLERYLTELCHGTQSSMTTLELITETIPLY